MLCNSLADFQSPKVVCCKSHSDLGDFYENNIDNAGSAKVEEGHNSLTDEFNYHNCLEILKQHKPIFDSLKKISEQTLESKSDEDSSVYHFS